MRTTPVLLTESDVLTTAETAETLGKSKQTIARWVDEGTITPLKRLPGAHGSYLFSAEEVERVRSTPRRRQTRPERRSSVA